MSAENAVQRKVWLKIGRTSIMFRCNTGKGWVSGAGPAYRMTDGSVRIPAGRTVLLGLGLSNGEPVKGTSDLIGYTPVVVTAEMVGQTLAVFTAVETKRTENGKTSADQKNFIKQVVDNGGIAGVANSEEAADHIFLMWHARFGA